MAGPSRSSYDAVVVGAGVIGLACAWRAAQRGLSVLVADRDAPGAGVSGVAAGMLAPVTEADFGEEAVLELNIAAAERWPAFAAELEALAPSGYAQSGALSVAVDRDDVEELRRLHDFRRRLELPVEWRRAREARALEPRLSPRVAAAVETASDHHVDPRTLVRALTAALEAAGGELAAPFSVEALETSDGRVTGIRGDSGRVETDRVVIAAGCWSATIAGIPAAPPIRPVKGQILRLRGEPGATPLANRLIRSPRCYVVARPSGEVVLGATQEERGFDTRVTAAGVLDLLEAAEEVLPDIRELELVEASARLRPATPDNAPVVGPGAIEGLVWATGHYRHGILLAPPTAERVAGLLAGADTEPLPACSPERFDAVRSAA
jgi:glycine oxidase